MDLIHVHTHICTFGRCLLRPPKQKIQGWSQFITLEVSLSFFWVMVFFLKGRPQKHGEKHKGVQKALWIVNALLRPYKQGAWFFHPPKNQQGHSKSLNVIHGLDLHSRSEDLCKLSGAKIKYSNSNSNFKNLFRLRSHEHIRTQTAFFNMRANLTSMLISFIDFKAEC